MTKPPKEYYEYVGSPTDHLTSPGYEFDQYMRGLKIEYTFVNLEWAKIGNITYYFRAGLIVVGDGEPEPERGLDALLALLGRSRSEVKFPLNPYIPPALAGVIKP
ncbi:hypothetical protein V5F49_19565 [Xanthobacter sp. V3C-3]|uniref:hypothetical protein n=1 Tax=Xanthobacter lutulentifluminis TaxID=3119935 RepID=UPI00372945A5